MDSLQQQLQQAQKAILRGQLDYAGRILDKLRQTHSSTAKVWFVSAAWYQAIGDNPAAVDALQQAAAMGLAEPELRKQVVNALMSMQAWKPALKLLKQIDPDGATNVVSMSRCEWGAGEYEAAIKRLQPFVVSNPQHSEAQLSLWQCLERAGHFDASDQQRQQCQQWVDTDPVTTIMDNAFLVADGQLDTAAARLETCQSKLETVHPGLLRGMLLINQLRDPDAATAARNAAPPRKANNPSSARNVALDEAHLQSLQWLQQHGDIPFFGSSTRLLVHAMQQAINAFSVDDWFMEFGVFHGRSLNILAQTAAAGGFHVHGFDSFEGLPEDWSNNEAKGSYSTDHQQPQVPANVTLHAGWFEDTLPKLVQQNDTAKAAFIHIDCDLYSSTKTVLDTLQQRCQSGTVVQFDELIGYHGYQEHEWKAWQEFLQQWPAGYQLLGAVFMGRAVAVQLH